MHMMRVNALPSEPRISSIDESEIKDIIKELKQKGLIYSPKPGYVDCVD
jgi:DNA replicative helicase MCM subunit Mcm2 (Cdc46/Mcm family)